MERIQGLDSKMNEIDVDMFRFDDIMLFLLSFLYN